MEQADCELLRAFVKGRRQQAFAALVDRHIRAVYNVARRNAGEVHAEDVAQAVFIVLARKAPALLNVRSLSGWLHRVTRDAAADALRRRTHEHRAAQGRRDFGDGAAEEMPEGGPSVDRALGLLRTADREVLILRFFQDASYVEIGRAMGISEDAARKRADRALVKMKRLLGATGATAGVAAVLTMACGAGVPATLGASIVSQVAGAAGLTGKAAVLAAGVESLMRLRNVKMAAAAMTMCGAAVVALWIARGVGLPDDELRLQSAPAMQQREDAPVQKLELQMLCMPARPAKPARPEPAKPEKPVEEAAKDLRC